MERAGGRWSVISAYYHTLTLNPTLLLNLNLALNLTRLRIDSGRWRALKVPHQEKD